MIILFMVLSIKKMIQLYSREDEIYETYTKTKDLFEYPQTTGE